MLRAWCLLAAACLTASCGGYKGGRVPAIGTVTIDGKPLANVYVTFRPDDGEPGVGGYAITDSSGRFEIRYPDSGPGLVPGRYRVTVAPPPRAPGDGPPNASPMAKKSDGTLSYPPVYSSPENSPLRVTITSDGQPVKVELSSTPGKAPAK